MSRKPLTDAPWALVRRFVLTDPRRGGRPPHDHRRRVDAILWVLRTGSPWRDLPTALGPLALGLPRVPALDAARHLAAAPGQARRKARRLGLPHRQPHRPRPPARGRGQKAARTKRSAARAAAFPPRSTSSSTVEVGRWTCA
jgi:transposase